MQLAKENRIDFLESSAKTGVNIEEIFNKLNNRIIEKIDKELIDVESHPGIKVGTEKYNNMNYEDHKGVTELTKKPENKKNKEKNCC